MPDMEQQLLPHLTYLSGEDTAAVLTALRQATAWHEGQERKSGEPYIIHPVAVAGYLATLEAERDVLIAALLHDVVEDDCATLDEVSSLFGAGVARLVDAVSKLSKMHYEGRRDEHQVASLRKMLLFASDDLRVIYIKLADRWHNLQTIGVFRPDKQKRIAAETLDIYVPFARLLGLWELKSFFEEVSFPMAFPEESAEWHEAIGRVRSSLQTEREECIAALKNRITLPVSIKMRIMTDYEVYRKFQHNKSMLREVQEIDSVRIRLENPDATEDDCYRVLGEIHRSFPVRARSFRDYISAPQPNGYSALHTIVYTAGGSQLKLRIQTAAMYEYASKRKISQWRQRDRDMQHALHALQSVPQDRQEFMNDLQNTVLKERITVFTPAGEIIPLPSGATGVDFAFVINPDYISYLGGIRVNGELLEATHVLKDGDTVQLVLHSDQTNGYQRMWLEKVKSVEAKDQLKKSLQNSPEEQQMDEGRKLLDNELRKRRLPLWWLFHLGSMQSGLAESMGRASFDELLRDIGTGLVPLDQVIRAYKQMLSSSRHWTTRFLHFLRLLPQSRVLNKESKVIDIEVYAEDRQGLIHDITRCFAERKINIAKFGVYALPPHDAYYRIRLEVKKFEDFSDLYDALIQVPSVKKIVRKH